MKRYKCDFNNTCLLQYEADLIERREIPVVFGSHGIVLQGKILMPVYADAAHPVPGAVLCHGFGSNRKAMEAGALLLVKEGIAAITFDLRGHGASAGALDGDYYEDVIDAWQTLSEFKEVDSTRIALIGHSLGALSSILAAGSIKKAKAVIALSCPFEIDAGRFMNPLHKVFPVTRWMISLVWRMANWYIGLKVRVDWRKFLESWLQTRLSVALAQLDQCAKLFIFSADDPITPYKRFNNLYNQAPGPKQKMLAGGSHATPIEAEMLRLEWVGWAVAALNAPRPAIETSY